MHSDRRMKRPMLVVLTITVSAEPGTAADMLAASDLPAYSILTLTMMMTLLLQARVAVSESSQGANPCWSQATV
jgi:hypothetical protein